MVKHTKLLCFWIITILACMYFLLFVCSLKAAKSSSHRITRHTKSKHYEILVDKRAKPNANQILEAAAHELSSYPFEYEQRQCGKSLKLNKTCALFPSLLKINFHNIYWQTFENDEVILQLFGAYYDNRQFVVEENGPVIRILAMGNQYEMIYQPNYCQIWFDKQTAPAIAPVKDYVQIWWWSKGFNQFFPYLITCTMPEESNHLIPQAVSLVPNQCDTARNNLRIIYEKPKQNETKHGIAICVKNFIFPFTDISWRVVEWLELMRVIGVRKVAIYKTQVHANISKVFDYYVNEGFLDVRTMTNARGEPSFPALEQFTRSRDGLNCVLSEIMSLNDCFYRNMYKYDYISGHDVDEVIMPLGNLTSLYDIIETAKNTAHRENCDSYASYCFRNVYFPKEQPSYTSDAPHFLYMLQHVKRVAEHLDPNLATKCLHNTNYVLTLHNHFPLHWIDSCAPIDVNVTYGQLQHYRDPDIKSTLDNLVTDANIWRFNETLIKKIMGVYEKLGFLETESYDEE